jgi:Icc-related predicted phosphoesterase
MNQKFKIKVSIASDLHLEHGALKGLPGGDVLLLAGDIITVNPVRKECTDARSIDLRKRYDEFFEKEISKYGLVLCIKGNHEFYSGLIENTNTLLKSYLKEHAPNCHVLDNEAYDIDGVRIIGSTFWATYGCGTPNHLKIQRELNDFNFIRTLCNIAPTDPVICHGRNINVNDLAAEHAFSMVAVQQLLCTATYPCVVLTHHAPSYLSIDAISSLDDAYASNQYLMIDDYRPKLWIHGHTHSVKSYEIGETKVRCNPRGYFQREVRAKYFDISLFDFDLEELKNT